MMFLFLKLFAVKILPKAAVQEKKSNPGGNFSLPNALPLYKLSLIATGHAIIKPDLKIFIFGKLPTHLILPKALNRS